MDAEVGSPDAGPIPEGATRFVMRIENVSGPALPSALGSGIVVVHAETDPLFSEAARDRGLGLEALAEDGDPSTLAAELDAATFGAIAPGDAREIVIDAYADQPRVSFATMLSESNDVFVAPAGEGIALFDESGRPLEARDVTAELHLWNAGTEADQAPGLGPQQAARQSAPGSGEAEGRIRRWTDATRTLPLARDILAISVRVEGRSVALSVQNVSQRHGLLVTQLSSLLWAVHDGTLRLFEEGQPAPENNGLERFAEDADPREISAWVTAQPGVRDSGVAGGGSTLVDPDARFEISVEPDAAHPYLGIAAMIATTNDAFLAFPDAGVRLLDANGEPRAAAEIERDILRSLTVWDAGTEANQVAGAGTDAGPREGVTDLGAPDPDTRVRRYADVTNDLAPQTVGGVIDVQIRSVGRSTFELSVHNRSGSSPYAMLLTPVVYTLHTDAARLFDPALGPSPGLRTIAEDCYTQPLHDELAATAGFARTAIAAVPVGAPESGPLFYGDRYVVTVEADPAHRFLNLAAMPYPSNDMFISFGPEGIELLDASGAQRSDEAIMADVRRSFGMWDVGTESNQAGGAGRDAVPLQQVLDIGAAEGDGTVRRQPDPVWSYPEVSELVRVTITPVAR